MVLQGVKALLLVYSCSVREFVIDTLFMTKLALLLQRN